jgi:hypothetical protein
MTINLSEEEIQLIYESLHGFASALEEWNFGDEYDNDTTPFRNLAKKFDAIRKKQV